LASTYKSLRRYNPKERNSDRRGNEATVVYFENCSSFRSKGLRKFTRYLDKGLRRIIESGTVVVEVEVRLRLTFSQSFRLRIETLPGAHDRILPIISNHI
jgi:hypothetical protein